MAKRITQRRLRNDSGDIMRALDRGESFVVTRNDVEVGELTPIRGRYFVAADAAVDAFRGIDPVERKQLRADLDEFADPDPTPRA